MPTGVNHQVVTDSLLEGRYRLDTAFSRGSVASTWKATDTHTGDPCVVKELSVGAAVREGSTAQSWDGDFTKAIELFEREARVLANLDHPAVPRFIDHFRVEDADDVRLFTVQEFVAGKDLEEHVRDGRHFTEDEAIEICTALAEVLGYLHDRSPPLIHRDVKPSNVILSDDGAVHLVDFGSVRNALDRDVLDGKTIVGTYGYMPMEQYEGRAVPQSDFYALGMTLVFLLSHRDPTTITRTGLSLDFRPFVNISDRLASLIEWMIRAAPEQRPPSADRIIAALDRNLDNLPAAPRTTGRSRWLAPEFQKRPEVVRVRGALAALVGTILLAISVVGFLFGWVGFTEGVSDAAVAPEAGSGAGGGRTGLPVPIEPDGDVVAIDLDRDLRYVDAGFPMQRAANQTVLPPLTRRLPVGVSLPLELRRTDGGERWFGSIPLGHDDGVGVDYALRHDGDGWRLWIDRNRDRDLSDDGPPLGNQGSGDVLAATVELRAVVRTEAGEERTRPYAAWVWFDATPDGGMTGRMYAVHHWAGRIVVGSDTVEVTAFEKARHDGLFRDAGVCVDANRDGRCDERTELALDGDQIVVAGRTLRIRLRYP